MDAETQAIVYYIGQAGNMPVACRHRGDMVSGRRSGFRRIESEAKPPPEQQSESKLQEPPVLQREGNGQRANLLSRLIAIKLYSKTPKTTLRWRHDCKDGFLNVF